MSSHANVLPSSWRPACWLPSLSVLLAVCGSFLVVAALKDAPTSLGAPRAVGGMFVSMAHSRATSVADPAGLTREARCTCSGATRVQPDWRGSFPVPGGAGPDPGIAWPGPRPERGIQAPQEDLRRDLVAAAGSLQRHRGTSAGLSQSPQDEEKGGEATPDQVRSCVSSFPC